MIACPQWDNRKIYLSLEDATVEQDLATLGSAIEHLRQEVKPLKAALNQLAEIVDSERKQLVVLARKVSLQKLDAQVLLSTLSTYVNCMLSVDASHERAKNIRSRLSKASAALEQATTSLDIFLKRIDDRDIEQFFHSADNGADKSDDAKLQALRFSIEHGRKMRKHLLDVGEETLIAGLSVDGLHAWGKLYNDIAGRLTCDVTGETLGYAETANLLGQGDREKRQHAWQAINTAWEQQEESVAAILNAINGWRLEANSARSIKKPLHYLDVSCHQSHISRTTLDTLMDASYQQRSIGQRALKSMAKVMQVDQLGPWDILACAPMQPSPLLEQEPAKNYSFDEAIEIIAKAFSALTPAMGEFASMMYEKGWIDAEPTPNRAPGAYCTGFARVREPRVFMTYDGSIGSVITLAHELGHAYHNWVMRDMPLAKARYPMTLAETASIFAETLVRDYLFEHSSSDAERLQIAWEEASSAAVMLCNIPARFEFEKRLVEIRKDNNLSPTELKQLMNDAWAYWYEDSLSEYDNMYWASKLHFSISGLGFYNYPYLFGYLFSLGIYAQKEKYGADFNTLYTHILRDTGSMTAEDLILKHLNQRIDQPGFWLGSLRSVEASVARFENLVTG